jgi:cytochrome c peroxidase
MKTTAHISLCTLLGFAAACSSGGAEAPTPDETLSSAAALHAHAGRTETVTATGTIDTTNEFFQSLGTNGRTCGSCHLVDQGWSITPDGLRARFWRTDGLDPIFLPHDAATSPQADVSTREARREAYRLLLDRGLIRVGLPVKATSEFTLVASDDPYGFASSAQLSLFRRPLPTTNLRFLTAVNWDGRSTPTPDAAGIRLGMMNQSNGATVNHAKAAAPLTDDVRASIVDFEAGLVTARSRDGEAGALDAAGATGGPAALLAQPFAIGANDPTQPGFTPKVFSLFDAWQNEGWRGRSGARRDLADGQRVFNEKTFDIGGGRTGTCSGCHSVPNVGGAAAFRFFDVGVSTPATRDRDLPLYTFQNTATGETVQTSDPGRALISGQWADMNRFKVPGLRGLAAHGPYFHDGSARTVRDVVEHYEARFDIAFRGSEKRDLISFLEAL